MPLIFDDTLIGNQSTTKARCKTVAEHDYALSRCGGLIID
jgi:hypothetical protein